MGNGMNRVLSGLYVGNYRDSKDASQLERHKITHIIAIHDAARRLHTDKEYLCIMASDSPYQNLSQYIPACNDFIHAARVQGGNVLIHCLAGMSRSVTIAVGYIMTITSLRWNEALKVVRGARPVSNPNSGFQKQLQEFEATKLVEERRRLAEKFAGTVYSESDEEQCKRLLVSYNNLLLSRAICEGRCTSARVCPTGTCRAHYASQRLSRTKSTERSSYGQQSVTASSVSGSSKSLDSASATSSPTPSPHGSPKSWERHYGCWRNHFQHRQQSAGGSSSSPGSPILYRVNKSDRSDSMTSISSTSSINSLSSQAANDREPRFVLASNNPSLSTQSCPNSPRRVPKKLPPTVTRGNSVRESAVFTQASTASSTASLVTTSTSSAPTASRAWSTPPSPCSRLQSHGSPAKTSIIRGTTRWIMKRSAYKYTMENS